MFEKNAVILILK